MNGKVKWYSTLRGYGFIECTEHPEGVFCGSTAVLLEPGQVLRGQDEVSFDVRTDRQGRLKAQNVQLVNPRSGADMRQDRRERWPASPARYFRSDMQANKREAAELVFERRPVRQSDVFERD